MIGAELLVKLDAELGTVDVAYIEHVIHDALTNAGVPVVDVEYEGMRVVDSPLPQPGLAPPGMVTPTLPPGARRL